MNNSITINFKTIILNDIQNLLGSVAVFIDSNGISNKINQRINHLTNGSLRRLIDSVDFNKISVGKHSVLQFPVGLAAQNLYVVKWGQFNNPINASKAGANLIQSIKTDKLHILAPEELCKAEFLFGINLRAYSFDKYKTSKHKSTPIITLHSDNAENVQSNYQKLTPIAEGVYFTRDLVNEPSNILTTTEFAHRLLELESLGITVEVFEESDMQKLGMHALLAVGLGSESPSKMVIMHYKAGGEKPPLALVGKGVVFDTGGISLKPPLGMEDMTMDMGGAGVVAGVMKTLALRKAKANVVGVVGLVENMPDGKAQRPGDIVKSMKGKTIEVINTDAEGRLVLADILCYTQQKLNPCGIINLATLTGAIIIGLGHEKAGVFSNDDNFVKDFLAAADKENEGSWRMPLASAYDQLLKSRIADMKNVGGRAAGSITAAQFLQRFIDTDMPWIHLDIAGVTLVKKATDFAPKGATGWGVRTLNRLIKDYYEYF